MNETIPRKTKTVKNGVIFLHIPKTGGSSISKALRQHYRFSNSHIKSEASARAALPEPGKYTEISEHLDHIQTLRLNLIMYWAQTGKKFLTGHVWNDEKLATLKDIGYLIVTCLRNPVNRWFSAYFYDHFKAGNHARIDQNIDEFLSSDRAINMGTTYVRYIGGLRVDGDYSSEKAIKEATVMLETIDILGVLENLDHFNSAISERLGIKIKLPHRRRSPADRSLVEKIKNSTEYRRQVEKLCIPDLELYERACSLMGK